MAITISRTKAPISRESKERILPRRLVIKCGTENLCSLQDGEKKLDQKIFDDYARQIVELQKQGVEVIVVSSGAIKAGRESLRELGIDQDNWTKTQLAAVGQGVLMENWRKAFRKYNKVVGQLLVTYANWEDEEEKISLKNSILGLLEKNQISILNENDPISDKEIVLMERRISENDRLARMIAFLIEAEAVLFLTDEKGIYTSDPKKGLGKSQFYDEISILGEPTELIGVDVGTSESGTGGIGRKIEEAVRCAQKGLRVAITGSEKDVILRFARGELVGTKIGTNNRLKETS